MPIWHIVFGAIASFILFLVGIDLLPVIVFFLSSWFLIDLDHAFYYVVKTKNFNPFKFWKISSSKRSLRKDPNVKKPIWIFHNVEFLLLLLIFSFFFKIVFFVFLGFLFHLFFDWIEMIYNKSKVYCKLSLISTLVKNKNKKDLL